MEPEIPVLTNRCHYDAETLRIAYRRYTRRWLVAFLTFGILFFVFGVYQSYRYIVIYQCELRLIWSPLISFAAAVYYFWKTFTFVNKIVKRSVQRLEETHQVSGFDNAYHFTQEEILDAPDVSNDVKHISYSVVKHAVPYQRLILVFTQAKQFFTLDRTRFENGTEADFWRLMNEKCPDVVPKKYRI